MAGLMEISTFSFVILFYIGIAEYQLQDQK